MNSKLQNSDPADGKYLLLQLFAFLCGSLLTLIYIPNAISALSAKRAALLIAAIFALAAAFSASLCACAVMPVLSAAFGAAVALVCVMIRAGFGGEAKGCALLSLIILTAVPLNFIVGSVSLGTMERIRGSLRGGEAPEKAQYARLYAAAASAAIASAGIAAAAIRYIDF